jgi:hypothetical protein
MFVPRLRKSLLLALPLLSLTLGGCKEEDPPSPALPAASQAGLNTAGCRVDGQVWLPVQGFLFAGPATMASLRQSVTGQQLQLSFSRFPADVNEAFNETIISFYVPDIRAVGPVELNQAADPRLTTANPAYGLYTEARPSPDQLKITSPTAAGQLVITRLDTVARIVAGTFEFTARAQDGPATVTVTDGRFDVRY